MSERIDLLRQSPSHPFLLGPAEALVYWVGLFISQVTQFQSVFSSSIYSYCRQDISLRELPALRIYNQNYTKEFDSWFVTGDLTLDVILPANIRRDKIQLTQDIISSALLQQFRRPTFFANIEANVPGLNELGKTFTANKALEYAYEDTVVPMVQCTVNFRVDLRIWDEYLTSQYLTKDDPFDVSLGDMKQIIFDIFGMDELAATGNGATGVQITTEINY